MHDLRAPETGSFDASEVDGQWGEGVEFVDELIFDDVIDEGASDETPRAFDRLVRAMKDVAGAFGAGATELDLLGGLLGSSRQISADPSSDPARALLTCGIVAQDEGTGLIRTRAFTGQAMAWKAILSGEEDRWADCGPANLDEWAATVVACVVARPGDAPAIRRELRRSGVAAFGFVVAA